MALPRLLSHLRRRPRSLSSLPSLSPFFLSAQPTPSGHCSSPPTPWPFSRPSLLGLPAPCWLASSFLTLSRSLHIDSSLPHSLEHGVPKPGFESATDLGFLDLGIGAGGSDVVGGSGIGGGGGGDESILPIRAVVSLLDGFHDLTGLPWWMVIALSTLVLRLMLFPVLVLQLQKMKQIAELFPKLPPPLPPPLSGRSFKEQIKLFRKEQHAIGCPSYLWFIANLSVQIPCFIVWMMSIREMSLNHHPGFDIGGALWFKNLTEYPHGSFGLIFPSLIAGLHYTNVQLSFRGTSFGKGTGLLSTLAKYYKMYLQLLTIPTFSIGYCVPQGSLVYWVTNASLTVIQQLSLHNDVVRKKLGLPDNKGPKVTQDPKENMSPGTRSLDPMPSPGKIAIQNLTPKELLALSVKLLAGGQKDRALPLLELALVKDPQYVRALVVMGQALLQKGLLADAIITFERAISKLHLGDHPMDVEAVDLLILASQWAGVACIRQGKNAEGIVHLERVANLKEPDDPPSKAHYFDGLLLLASALYNEGRKAEAAKFLRMVVSYNPAYREFLEQCESDEDTLVSDLVSSRRREY